MMAMCFIEGIRDMPLLLTHSRYCGWLFHSAATLCSMFRPEFYWWRLVLTLRKLCEVVVALMLSSKPLFQAWCVWPRRCTWPPLPCTS